MEGTIKMIERMVREAMGDLYDVTAIQVEKNNGVLKNAIKVCRDGAYISTVIPIDSMIGEIEYGESSLDEVVCQVVAICMGSGTERTYEMYMGLSREYILENVVYQMVWTEKNIKKLAGVPHKEVLDLSAVYRIVFEKDESSMKSAVVTYAFCRKYGIAVDELDAAARRNTESRGFMAMSMWEALAGIIGLPEKAGEMEDPQLPRMFIITDQNRMYGASALLYPKYFEWIARKCGGDMYILPSSIHEVIAVPAYGVDPHDLRLLVEEVNATEVAEDEILGGSVYQYSLDTGEITIALGASSMHCSVM